MIIHNIYYEKKHRDTDLALFLGQILTIDLVTLY